MKYKLILTIVLFLSLTNSYSQKQTFSFAATVEISEDVKELFKNTGRFYLFLSKNPYAEPRTQTWPSPFNKTFVFAKNCSGLNFNAPIKIGDDGDWITTADWS